MNVAVVDIVIPPSAGENIVAGRLDVTGQVKFPPSIIPGCLLLRFISTFP